MTHEAARGLDARRLGVVAGLDFGDAGAAAEVERRRRLAIEALEAGRHPVARRDERFDLEMRLDARVLAREVLVDRARGTLAVGDRVDQVARTEGDVAAGVDAGGRGRERDRIDPDRPAGRERDAVLRR